MFLFAGRILEAKNANNQLEMEKVKNEVLTADNKSMQTELELAQQKLTELENENKLQVWNFCIRSNTNYWRFWSGSGKVALKDCRKRGNRNQRRK